MKRTKYFTNSHTGAAVCEGLTKLSWRLLTEQLILICLGSFCVDVCRGGPFVWSCSVGCVVLTVFFSCLSAACRLGTTCKRVFKTGWSWTVYVRGIVHHFRSFAFAHVCFDYFCSLQIAKVERYETKLSVMAFIGVFDELMRTVMPVCLSSAWFMMMDYVLNTVHYALYYILLEITVDPYDLIGSQQCG